MWYLLTITYEGFKEVKRNKLSRLTHPYGLFNMEGNESIQAMLYKFQVIINELCSLGRVLEDYELIDNII